MISPQESSLYKESTYCQCACVSNLSSGCKHSGLRWTQSNSGLLPRSLSGFVHVGSSLSKRFLESTRRTISSRIVPVTLNVHVNSVRNHPISLKEGSSVVALPAPERHAYRQRKRGHRGQLLTRSRSLFRAARRASADATMPICTKEAEFSGPHSEDSTYNGGSQMPHFKETTLSELLPPKMLEREPDA